MDFDERNYTKCSAMRTLDKHFACLGVIYKELWRHEDEYSCRGEPTKAATSLQQVVVDLFVCIKLLVEMLYGGGAELLIGAHEFRHDICGKCEQRDKNKNDSPLDDTERSEYVSLAGACSPNDGKVIPLHGMEKTINGVKLCGIHLVNTPN